MVTGTDNAANTATLTNSYTVIASDQIPPVVTIATPKPGAVYHQNAAIFASYSCADNAGGVGVASCVGPVASGATLDTSTLGAHTFTVTGTDNASNTATLTNSYTIVDADLTPPVVTVTAPANGAIYVQNKDVNSAFSCVDEPAGSGLASCTGPAPSGTLIDTTVLGPQAFTVTGTDKVGNVRTVTTQFTVAETDQTPPVVAIFTPSQGATYSQGRQVTAHYDCTDELGGSGLASVVADVPDGAPINTTVLGSYTFTVTGTDTEGNSTTVTHSYTVAERSPGGGGGDVTLPGLVRQQTG